MLSVYIRWMPDALHSWTPSSRVHCTVTLTNDHHQGQQNKFGPGSFWSHAPGDICGVATVQMMDISPREVRWAKHTVDMNDGHSSFNRSLDDRGKEPARRSTTILESKKTLKKREELQDFFQTHFLALMISDELWDLSRENSNSETPFQFLSCGDWLLSY